MGSGSKRITVRVVRPLLLLGIFIALGLRIDGPCGECRTAAAQGNVASLGTIYVDHEAAGANDGSSWADAFTDLQAGLAAALAGDEVWVAAGTYLPGTSREDSFAMKNEVGIYGGFDPTTGDVDWEDRDWVANETILSGDIGAIGDDSDNCYHVFYHPEGTSLDETAILDGFTVSGGYADGSGDHNSGGGMYNSGSSPALANCTFEANSAGLSGGGMYNYHSSPTLTNCSFSDNHVETWKSYARGGGMYNSGSLPTLTSCTFVGNSAWEEFFYAEGGAMYNTASSPTLTDCAFSANVASTMQGGAFGGGMYNEWSSPALTN